jgi:hypothetical protein
MLHCLFFYLVIYLNKVDDVDKYNMDNFFNLLSISLLRRKQNADSFHPCRSVIDENLKMMGFLTK